MNYSHSSDFSPAYMRTARGRNAIINLKMARNNEI